MSQILQNSVEYLKGVGPQKAKLLQKEFGIYTFGDLLYHYPFRYVDKTKVHTVNAINPNSQHIQLRGTISDLKIQGEGRGRRLTANLRDATGRIELVWFKGIGYIQKYLQPNAEYLVYGKPNFKYRYSIAHPELEKLDADAPVSLQSRMAPVYASTEKLKSRGLDGKGFHRLMVNLFSKVHKRHIVENIPIKIREKYQLIGRYAALKNIHLPENDGIIEPARRRLKFEEFFMLQTRLHQLKISRQARYQGHIFQKVGPIFNQFYHEKLPFQLTGAQKRVIREIRRDTATGKQMNRLLQGDVGSGKTIVALMSMLLAIDNGFQACLMAPTEILAQQHLEGISELLEGLDIRVDLLTGSIKGKKRRTLLDSLQLGLIDILIGTHALIEDAVVFKELGFVVIDEQHRFGVAQRAKLWEKSAIPPHVLVMTATPIPRTLAMTAYGDLDVSVIDELPPGRKPIKTIHAREGKRLKVFSFIKSEIDKGRQVYIVYPLINESETLDYKDLMDGYESIQRAFPLPDYRISIVHGQMHTIDKDEEMQRFKRGETHIMVATTVIEVGVNVPNASLMIIESAERFGLAQLHQLRGRVGRGAEQSYCILMTGDKLTSDGRVRMKTLTETNDGFVIAETDLKLRGPGNMHGTEQSGILNFKIADIIKDNQLLHDARKAAAQVVQNDPDLTLPENAGLRHHLQQMDDEGKMKWSRIS